MYLPNITPSPTLPQYNHIKENCSSLIIGDLLKLALDVASGCFYLEENHFIHRYACIVKWLHSRE